eukprot:3138017-Rhodomonas_salina.2
MTDALSLSELTKLIQVQTLSSTASKPRQSDAKPSARARRGASKPGPSESTGNPPGLLQHSDLVSALGVSARHESPENMRPVADSAARRRVRREPAAPQDGDLGAAHRVARRRLGPRQRPPLSRSKPAVDRHQRLHRCVRHGRWPAVDGLRWVEDLNMSRGRREDGAMADSGGGLWGNGCSAALGEVRGGGESADLREC